MSMIIGFENERIQKLNELNGVIGKECSENFSPTLRAKLISCDNVSEVCVMEVVESPYVSMTQMDTLNKNRVGERYNAPASRIWNAFFF